MGAVLLLGTTAVLIMLLAMMARFAVRRSARGVRLAGLAAAIVVAAYATSLVVVSAATPARPLAVGEWKCFDDWCVTLSSSQRSGDQVTIMLSVRNRGQREQAPDTARAWLLHGDARDAVPVPGLDARIAGSNTTALAPVQIAAPVSAHPSLLVTEGGLPSVLVIGDENSPLHPPRSWPLY